MNCNSCEFLEVCDKKVDITTSDDFNKGLRVFTPWVGGCKKYPSLNVEKNVDHPTHYQQEGRKECIVEMLEKYGFNATANFALLNAYKYLYRMGLKYGNPSENDFKKAQWYFVG